MSQCSDPNKLPKRSALIRINDHDGCDSVLILEWNSQKVDDGVVLKQYLIDLLTEWFLTSEGYDAYQEANDRFTITDLDPENDHLKPALEAQGIFNLTKRYISAPECSWDQFDSLYEMDREDDFSKADEERNRDEHASEDGGSVG